MKKITSLLLAISLLMSFIVLPANAEENSNLLKERTVLSALNIIQTGESDDLSATVTRAEFTSYMAAALRALPVTNTVYFYDVQSSYWAAGDINAMYEYGIIASAEDGRFNPDDPVTYEQACKMLTVAMGFDEYAGTLGSGMAGYVLLARQVGFDIEPQNAAALNLGETIQMFYEAMQKDVAYEYGISEGKIIKRVTSGKNLFGIYHDTYIATGRLTAVGSVSIGEGASSDEDLISIDGTYYRLTDGLDALSYLGETIEYIYTETGGDAYAQIFYLERVTDTAAVIIDSNCVERFDLDSYTLTHYRTSESDVTATKLIDRGAVVIYNGRQLQGSLSEKIEEFADGTRKGSMKLVRSGSGGKYDIVIINSYRIFVAGAYDADRQILYNHNHTGDQIDLESYDSVKIRDPFSTLSAMPSTYPAAFGVAESDDGHSLELFFYTDERTIMISEVTSGDEPAVMADGERIGIDKTMYPYLAASLKAGTEIRVVCDQFGEIVHITAGASEDMQVGYLRRAATESNGFDYELLLELFMSDGSFQTLRLADRVTIDGESYKKDDRTAMAGAFPGGSAAASGGAVTIPRQLLRFNVNSEGLINEIDTYTVGPNEDKDITLTRHLDASRTYLHVTQQFALTDIYDTTNTIIFAVPDLNENGMVEVAGEMHSDTRDMYSLGYTFLYDGYYRVETYYYKNTYISDAVVVHAETDRDLDEVYMFNESGEGLGSDGEALKTITCMGRSGAQTFFVDSSCEADIAALVQGDLVKFNTNIHGDTVLSVEKLYDATTATLMNDGTNKYWYGGTFSETTDWNWRGHIVQLLKTYAYDFRGAVYRGSYELYDAQDGIFNQTTNVTSSIGVVIFDPENKNEPISSGTVSDILCYKTAGDNCDTVLTYNRYGTTRALFVYK